MDFQALLKCKKEEPKIVNRDVCLFPRIFHHLLIICSVSYFIDSYEYLVSKPKANPILYHCVEFINSILYGSGE